MKPEYTTKPMNYVIQQTRGQRGDVPESDSIAEPEVETHPCRSNGYIARDWLIKQGYQVIRIGDTSSPFHLIAWKTQTDIIFIRIKSVRTILYPETLSPEIRFLAGIVRRNELPGEVQFWIRVNRSWIRYRGFPGGAQVIDRDP